MKRLLVMVFSIGIFSFCTASCSSDSDISIESPEIERPDTPGEPAC